MKWVETVGVEVFEFISRFSVYGCFKLSILNADCGVEEVHWFTEFSE
jgi:hypothetical protein